MRTQHSQPWFYWTRGSLSDRRGHPYGVYCAPYDRDFLAPVDLVEARTVIMVTSPLVENTRFPLLGPNTPTSTRLLYLHHTVWYVQAKILNEYLRMAVVSCSGLGILRVTVRAGSQGTSKEQEGNSCFKTEKPTSYCIISVLANRTGLG
ncbi:hypothetical protein F5Y13DRAFT_18341 [Hypoxylon sp. FL1857]|nr:hypothetical protein F5Y13DRAFT_18341 [Hypoxylon sp. FL1857]